MALPTDAEALFKAALADPADEVSRLVFADWLEDRGTADAAAWAEFVRLGTVSHHGAMPPRERARRRLLAAEGVTAKLRLPLAEFVSQSVGLLHLLPASNITVKLGGGSLPLAVVAQLQHYTARQRTMIAVEWSGWHPDGVGKGWTERTLVVAAADPRAAQAGIDRDDLWNTRGQNVSPGTVHCVGANADEIQAAVAANYDRLRRETAVRTLLLGFPMEAQADAAAAFGTLDVPPVVRLVQGLLTDAVYQQVGQIRMAAQSQGAQVRTRNGDGWRNWNFVPWWLQTDVVAGLRQMADLPPLYEERPEFEAGVVRFRHREQDHDFLLEIRRTPYGPDVTLQAMG